ncbi:DUF983 domain-containing protein [Sphingomonas sp. LY160]|uniref:DUF983 domain-containing protein n=1 Tax=Sphingomonas sp. LY160 TaxID=3095342 RepID=UPI002ADEDA21|nr:DUF983 domain-containing protein [Sphingomonas sp. LY160]MEA1072198.1 DUF983 domain-containing protein [Sphingomonas sp. LY160]
MNGEAPVTGAHPFDQPSLAAATLRGLCPRCGARTLFDGFVRLTPKCRNCGLDVSAYNVGDGPAAFLILIVGTIVAVSAIVVDQAAGPPWWVHLVWIPIGLGLTLGGLRLGKAALLYQEVSHQAREGRLVE